MTQRLVHVKDKVVHVKDEVASEAQDAFQYYACFDDGDEDDDDDDVFCSDDAYNEGAMYSAIWLEDDDYDDYDDDDDDDGDFGNKLQIGRYAPLTFEEVESASDDDERLVHSFNSSTKADAVRVEI